MEETSSLAAATAVSLPEDVVREILARVWDTAALFRCAVTCRRWNHLVVDASYLRCRGQDQGACCGTGTSTTTLDGFLTQKRLDHRDRATSLIPTSQPLGTGRRRLGSLFPNATTPLLDHAVPLAARRGLLLVRLAMPYEDRVRLAVYDLSTGACDELPLLDHNYSDFGESGYAILTSADCSTGTQRQLPAPLRYSIFFKVMVLGIRFEYPQNLHMFSSSEARWSYPKTLHFDTTNIGPHGPVRHPDGVVCHGTVHWLVGDWSNVKSYLYTLDLDTETRLISFTKIPDPTNSFCSLSHDEPQLKVATDGTLSLLVLHRPGLQLQIYARQYYKSAEDVATAGWICSRVVQLKPPKQIERRAMHLSILGEKGGMILLKDRQRHVYIGDLETGTMKEMDCLGWFNRPSVVLLEMDWPAFFVSRLGSK